MPYTLRNTTAILASLAVAITLLIIVYSTCKSPFKLGITFVKAVGLGSVVALGSIAGLVSVMSVV